MMTWTMLLKQYQSQFRSVTSVFLRVLYIKVKLQFQRDFILTSDGATKNMVVDTSNTQRHKCKKCIASFTSVKSLSAHMRIHKTNNGKPAKIFNIPPIFKYEPPMVEEKVQRICNICNTEFTSLKSLK